MRVPRCLRLLPFLFGGQGTGGISEEMRVSFGPILKGGNRRAPPPGDGRGEEDNNSRIHNARIGEFLMDTWALVLKFVGNTGKSFLIKTDEEIEDGA